MKQKAFEDYGIKIFTENGKCFIEYDAGEIVAQMDEIEVSKEDAERAQKSADDAYRVILEYQSL